MNYRVEGILFDKGEEATVVAERIFERYDQIRDIHIYKKNHSNDTWELFKTLPQSKKEFSQKDLSTVDWVDEL